MSLGFVDLVEEIKSLSSEEKEELSLLIEKFLAEERREEIYQNYRKTLREHKKDKLIYSSDVGKLREMLE